LTQFNLNQRSIWFGAGRSLARPGAEGQPNLDKIEGQANFCLNWRLNRLCLNGCQADSAQAKGRANLAYAKGRPNLIRVES